MRAVIVSIILCCFGLISFAQEDFFVEGNEAYKNGAYAKAIENYTKVLNQELASPELYYNLGNAYFKNQELGKAILYFEKAYKAKPSDNNIKQNLNLAREEIDSPVLEIPEFFLLRYWKTLAGIFPTILWNLLQLVFALLFLFGIYNWRMGATEESKLKGFSKAAIGLVLIVLTFFAGRTAYKQSTSQDTAIVIGVTKLMSAPDTRSEEKENLSEGVKIKILDQIDDWYKVLLMNKEHGWVVKSQVGVI